MATCSVLYDQLTEKENGQLGSHIGQPDMRVQSKNGLVQLLQTVVKGKSSQWCCVEREVAVVRNVRAVMDSGQRLG